MPGDRAAEDVPPAVSQCRRDPQHVVVIPPLGRDDLDDVGLLDALRAVAPGGAVVCAGIHMSEIPAFPYEILWGERTLRSVANLTRADATDHLELRA